MYCVGFCLILAGQTTTMKKYTLHKQDSGRKDARFIYTVKDENGQIVSTRKSERDYVACTADGSFYFGRLDLIGKGDHGKQIKYAMGWGRDEKTGKMVPNKYDPSQERLDKLNAIAYLVAETPAPVQPAETTPAETDPVVSVDEADFQKWMAAKKAQYQAWKAGSANGTIKDDENPAFMFSGVWTSLLVQIAKGEISAQYLAQQELVNRGLDLDGKWVGFAEAEKIHFPTL